MFLCMDGSWKSNQQVAAISVSDEWLVAGPERMKPYRDMSRTRRGHGPSLPFPGWDSFTSFRSSFELHSAVRTEEPSLPG